MEPGEFQVRIPGLELSGLAWGDASDPTILAFHGWLDNAATFSKLGPILARAGRRVLAVDLPGHGRSDHRSADAHYHYINYAIDAVAIADALELESFDLLGHSMGVGVGLLAVPGLGERVGQFLAIEGLGPLTTPGADAGSTFRVAADAHRRVRARSRGVYPDAEAAVARKAAAIGTDLETARPIAMRSLVEAEGGFQFGDDPRLSGRSFFRLTESQVQGFLRCIDIPVTLVQADDGLRFPADAMADRLACLKQVVLRTLPGHHHLHLDTPSEVAHALGFEV